MDVVGQDVQIAHSDLLQGGLFLSHEVITNFKYKDLMV